MARTKKISPPNYEREKAENQSLKLQLQQFWQVIYHTEMELAACREKVREYRNRAHHLERQNQELIGQIEKLNSSQQKKHTRSSTKNRRIQQSKY